MTLRLAGIIALAALAAWSSFWFLGREAQEEALARWMLDRRQAGWEASYDDLAISGYPNRYDLTARNLRLGDPGAGWRWAAPELRLFTLAWRPDNVVVDWPPTQTLQIGGEEVTIASPEMRSSVAFRPGVSLPLAAAFFDAPGLTLVGSGGWTASARLWSGELRQATGDAAGPASGGAGGATGGARDGAAAAVNRYAFSLDIADLAPPEALAALLGAEPGAPVLLDQVSALGAAAFDRPLDRRALEQGGVRPTALDIEALRIEWGSLRLTASGALTLDAQGRPEGVLDLRARDWRRMLRALTAGGVIDPGAAGGVETALALFAALSGDPDSIDAPLAFRRGLAFLGPVPIGPAPVILPPR